MQHHKKKKIIILLYVRVTCKVQTADEASHQLTAQENGWDRLVLQSQGSQEM